MEPNWEKIYLQLYSYADQLLKAHFWFRGKTNSYLKGKQPHDYVIDAIEKYLLEPEKYDRTKRTLVGYLKYHILRHQISNDSNSAENNTMRDLFVRQDEEVEANFIDLLLPYPIGLIEQEIDFKKIMAEIEDSVKEDDATKIIFEGICKSRLKRRDMINEYNMSTSQYDNGMKRLKTILKQVAKKYSIKEPKRMKKGA